MNSLFLSNEIIVYIFSQSILYIFLLISFILSLNLLKNWDFSKTTSFQYSLEKKSYLNILIIFFTFVFKLFLFFYYIFSIDSLSSFVTGAMCSAGIFASNIFGNYVLLIKIFGLFFIGLWLILNSLDLKEKNYLYTKKKYALYIFSFFIFSLEYFLDFAFLLNIPTKEPLTCCSLIFGANNISSTLPFNLSLENLLLIFYLLYLLLVFLAFQGKSFLFMLINFVFLYLSFFAVTYFFSTYIYELPSHQCPFCLLKQEYYFIGYLIWASLFLGVFFSFSNFFIYKLANKNNFLLKYSLLFLSIFVLVLSFYPLKYYFINGVLL